MTEEQLLTCYGDTTQVILEVTILVEEHSSLQGSCVQKQVSSMAVVEKSEISLEAHLQFLVKKPKESQVFNTYIQT